MDGYIKLWRKSLESSVWTNINLWRFWTWCLMKASYKPRIAKVGYQDVPLEPGQFVFGRHKASLETRLSEQTIKTCLKHLENMENLTIKTTNKYSIISIRNWDKYQNTDQPTNQQVTNNQPATNHKQEGKEGKKIKEVKEIYARFEIFWKAYPRKKSKGQAEKAFLKINPDEQLLVTMLATIERAKKSDDWLREGGKYIPYPATWLNARGWEDEISKEQKEEEREPHQWL